MYKLLADYRPARPSDLDGINKLIQSAVMNWPMPIRLKRRAVPVLQYDAVDLKHLNAFVCCRGNDILGVSTMDLEQAPGRGLLHGLYVLPIIQGHGIGQQLMGMAFDWAADHHLRTVLIRAESVSAPYFRRLGLEPLEGLERDDYPHQFEVTLTHHRLAKAS